MINSNNLHTQEHRQEAKIGKRQAGASALWREKVAYRFNDADTVAVKELLNKAVLLNEPKWAEARKGDAATAIALAVAEWPVINISPRVDLIMSAILFAGMTGSAAAAVVLAHVLRQLPGGRKIHKRIAASWLTRNLQTALAKRARRPSAPTRLLMKSTRSHATGGMQ
jgi:hypothetical protein